MFFVSEKYVDEKIDSLLEEIHSIKKNYEEKNKNILEQVRNNDSRIYEIGNILNDLKKSIVDIKDDYERSQQIVTDDIVKLFEQINVVKDVCLIGQEEFKTELDTLLFEQGEKEKIDLTPLYNKVAELDQSTLDHFKIVHDTMMKFSEIIDIRVEKNSVKIESKKPEHQTNNSYNERRLHDLNEKISGLSEKLDAAIELIFEKISSLNAEESEIPEALLSDRCPFKSKQGYCDLWANRKNKRDALIYCSSCMQASELLDKGVKL